MIALLDYGAGNTESVANALHDVTADFEIITEAGNLPRETDRIILPGVGEASSAMKRMSDKGLSELIRKTELPFLGICLGMQLLCGSSAEGDAECLGILDTDAERFDPEKVKIPHMGWNKVFYSKEDPIFNGIPEGSFFYFANSFYVPMNKNTTAYFEYGGEFSAATRKDNFFGVQFHPEKSGELGVRILKNFTEIKL